jgi:lysophospholipase L1-like esterase
LSFRICFVGDSYVNGTGDAEALGWRGRVCRAAWDAGLPITHYDLGVRGDTSDMIAARWRAECAARLPGGVDGRLVFSFGLNDAAEVAGAGLRVAQGRSVANARAMVAEAKAWLPTLWIGPPPANEAMSPMTPTPGMTVSFAQARIDALNAAYAEVAAELDAPYLDLSTPLRGEPRYVASQSAGDGLHPSAEGYRMIADLVLRWPAWRAWMKPS